MKKMYAATMMKFYLYTSAFLSFFHFSVGFSISFLSRNQECRNISSILFR